jgi:hypothetical protein
MPPRSDASGRSRTLGRVGPPDRLTPLGVIVRGAAAGAVGTLAMDLVWYARYRREGGNSGFTDWEFSAGVDSWDSAPVPAQFGKRIFEGLFRRDLPPQTAGLVNNVTHWVTGMGWGATFGVLSGSVPTRRAWHGLVFGAGVWVQSYAVLVPAKLYKPPWDYDAVTLWKDLSAHLVYGLGTATAFRVLAGRSDRRRPHRLGQKSAVSPARSSG